MQKDPHAYVRFRTGQHAHGDASSGRRPSVLDLDTFSTTRDLDESEASAGWTGAIEALTAARGEAPRRSGSRSSHSRRQSVGTQESSC